ncbi:MAG: 2-amino-4-hydroxy-6-hydroxymethyldihydropteridine diphosphokinase [Muribaculaceae bacterium]|nr:2-amino-4-hydroxy-6-hydroxymethyldihydropteridine diphosphokinase [Muribaculaceae bacterium]
MHEAHLNIGSNYGDRMAYIARAVALLSEHLEVVAVSDPVESDPDGFDSTNRFVNVGLTVRTELDPLALLDLTQRTERSVGRMPHRNPDGTYRDRDIDIDIIYYDDLRVNSARLTLPHPRMGLREFVLRPLRQLNPHKAKQLYDQEMESNKE